MSTPKWKKAQRQAEHAKQKRVREYEKLVSSIPKRRKKEFVEYKPEESYVRETPNYPSLSSTSIPAGGAKKESQKYTGDYIIGIATTHKSNLVPVSRGDNPVDYATMRRN